MLTCFSRAAFIILFAFILFLARAVLWSSSSSRGTAAYRHNVVNWRRHSIKTCVHQRKNGLTLNKNKLEKNVTISKTAVAWTRSCGRHGNRGTATCEFGLRNPRDDQDKLRINAGRFKSRSLAQWSRGDNDPVSAAPAGPWGHALYALIGHLTEATLGWGHQALAARLRDPQHTLPQIQPSTVGLIFQKCAQVETRSEVPRVRFYLVIKNPPDGTDLLQLRICDAISDITLLQTSGTVQERGYQMFTTDSLPAGSNYVETYTANVKGSRNEVLSLPALLSFSKNSENDISLFDPVVANFTLRLNATEKVYAHHALHFAGFSGGFLASTLLFSLMLFITSCLYNKWHKLSSHHRRRRGFSRGMELEEAASIIIESANEDALFEDKIIDIMALEDPQNVFQALDNLEMSALLREAVAVEGIRVKLVKGVFGVLLGGVGVAGQHVFTVLLGQVVGMEGKLQEEQEARLATLAAQCTVETRREMEALHHTHTTEKTYAERLQCAQQQEVLEGMALLERLQKKEQKWLQRALQTKHELASAQAQRHTALRRRAELHAIFNEELQEAASMGEMEEDMANHLLHCYYTCQDQLEDVLDFFVANRRAVLSERHAHRKFLLQGLHGQQRLLWDMFRASSQHMDSWFTEIRREGGLCDEQCSHQLEHAQLDLLQVKQSLEDTLNREYSSMHCDIIKKRRASILDMLREHMREQRELVCVWGGRVDEYLLRWQTILSAHSTQLSELIMHLDQEAAAEIHKLLLRVQQEAVAELKAVAGAVAQALQTLGVPRWLLHSEVGAEGVAEAQERLLAERKVWAGSLRASRSSTQQCRQMELQQQTALRERLRQYCRCMCMSQPAMSERDLLRARLECAKRMCCLDRCLVLPHALSRARQYTSFTGPITQSCQSDPRTDVSNDTHTGNTSLTLKETKNALISGENFMEAGDKDLVSFIRSVAKRINLHQQERRRNMSMEETYMCEDQGQKVYFCEQDVAKAVVALQWERGERRSRVLETHSALLELQSLLLQHLRHTPAEQELTNTIHAQSLALEEAELQLQKEEAEWKALAYECSSTKLLIVADGIDAQFFRVDKVCRTALSLQEALCKRQQLTQTLTERLMEEISRQQAMEDLRDQLELKPLYTHCDQDLALTALLVKLSGVSVIVLQEILRLLLPTLPEGELQSLIDALSPKAGQTLEPCTELVDRLKKDIIRRNLSSWSHHTEKQLGRNLRKKQTFLDKLFFISPEGSKSLLKVQDQTRKQKPVPVSDAAKEEAPSGPGGAKAETWYKEYMPAEDIGVAIESPVSGERLFVFRCSPPGDQEHTHSLPPLLKSECNHKKRSFLKFKKGTVAPQEQMQEKEEEQRH